MGLSLDRNSLGNRPQTGENADFVGNGLPNPQADARILTPTPSAPDTNSLLEPKALEGTPKLRPDFPSRTSTPLSLAQANEEALAELKSHGDQKTAPSIDLSLLSKLAFDEKSHPLAFHILQGLLLKGVEFKDIVEETTPGKSNPIQVENLYRYLEKHLEDKAVQSIFLRLNLRLTAELRSQIQEKGLERSLSGECYQNARQLFQEDPQKNQTRIYELISLSLYFKPESPDFADLKQEALLKSLAADFFAFCGESLQAIDFSKQTIEAFAGAIETKKSDPECIELYEKMAREQEKIQDYTGARLSLLKASNLIKLRIHLKPYRFMSQSLEGLKMDRNQNRSGEGENTSTPLLEKPTGNYIPTEAHQISFESDLSGLDFQPSWAKEALTRLDERLEEIWTKTCEQIQKLEKEEPENLKALQFFYAKAAQLNLALGKKSDHFEEKAKSLQKILIEKISKKGPDQFDKNNEGVSTQPSPSLTRAHEKISAHLKDLLGPLVHSVFQKEGYLDLKRINVQSFEEFKQFLIAQVSIDGMALNQHLLASYHQVLAQKEFLPLLKILYAEIHPEADPSEIPDATSCEELLHRFQKSIATVSYTRFVERSLSSPEGRSRLNAILHDPMHYPPAFRAIILKEMMCLADDQKIIPSHLRRLFEKKLSSFGVSSVADLKRAVPKPLEEGFDQGIKLLGMDEDTGIDSESLQQATHYGERLLKYAAQKEAQQKRIELQYRYHPQEISVLRSEEMYADLSPQRLSRRAKEYLDLKDQRDLKSEVKSKLLHLWLVTVDNANWTADTNGTYTSAKTRALVLNQLDRFLSEADHLASEIDLKSLCKRIGYFLKGEDPEQRSGLEKSYEWTLSFLYRGDKIEKMYADLPAAQKSAFRDLEKISNEIDACEDMHQALSLENPQVNLTNEKLKPEVQRLIYALRTTQRELWYSYKKQSFLYRAAGYSAPGQIALYLTGEQADIRQVIRLANGRMDALIESLSQAKDTSQIQTQLQILASEMKDGGDLHAALSGLDASVGKDLFSLGETIGEMIALEVLTGGLAEGAAVARAGKMFAKEMRMGRGIKAGLKSFREERALQTLAKSWGSSVRTGRLSGAFARNEGLQARTLVREMSAERKLAEKGLHWSEKAARRGVHGFTTGARMSVAGNVVANLSDQIREGEIDTLFAWIKQSLATGFSMLLTGPFEKEVAEATSIALKNGGSQSVFRKVLTRALHRSMVSLRGLVPGVLKEIAEESADNILLKLLEGKTPQMSWEEFYQLVKACATGQGQGESFALAKSAKASLYQRSSTPSAKSADSHLQPTTLKAEPSSASTAKSQLKPASLSLPRISHPEEGKILNLIDLIQRRVGLIPSAQLSVNSVSEILSSQMATARTNQDLAYETDISSEQGLQIAARILLERELKKTWNEALRAGEGEALAEDQKSALETTFLARLASQGVTEVFAPSLVRDSFDHLISSASEVRESSSPNNVDAKDRFDLLMRQMEIPRFSEILVSSLKTDPSGETDASKTFLKTQIIKATPLQSSSLLNKFAMAAASVPAVYGLLSFLNPSESFAANPELLSSATQTFSSAPSLPTIALVGLGVLLMGYRRMGTAFFAPSTTQPLADASTRPVTPESPAESTGSLGETTHSFSGQGDGQNNEGNPQDENRPYQEANEGNDPLIHIEELPSDVLEVVEDDPELEIVELDERDFIDDETDRHPVTEPPPSHSPASNSRYALALQNLSKRLSSFHDHPAHTGVSLKFVLRLEGQIKRAKDRSNPHLCPNLPATLKNSFQILESLVHRMETADPDSKEFHQAQRAIEDLTKLNQIAQLAPVTPALLKDLADAQNDLRALGQTTLLDAQEHLQNIERLQVQLSSAVQTSYHIAQTLVESHHPVLPKAESFIDALLSENPEIQKEVVPKDETKPPQHFKTAYGLIQKLVGREVYSLDYLTDVCRTRRVFEDHFAAIQFYRNLKERLNHIEDGKFPSSLRIQIRNSINQEGEVNVDDLNEISADMAEGFPSLEEDHEKSLLIGRTSGYRGLHLVMDIEGFGLELQIRTRAIDEWDRIQHDLYKAHMDYSDRPWIVGFCKEVSDYLFNVEKGQKPLPAPPSFDWSRLIDKRNKPVTEALQKLEVLVSRYADKDTPSSKKSKPATPVLAAIAGLGLVKGNNEAQTLTDSISHPVVQAPESNILSADTALVSLPLVAVAGFQKLRHLIRRTRKEAVDEIAPTKTRRFAAIAQNTRKRVISLWRNVAMGDYISYGIRKTMAGGILATGLLAALDATSLYPQNFPGGAFGLGAALLAAVPVATRIFKSPALGSVLAHPLFAGVSFCVGLVTDAVMAKQFYLPSADFTPTNLAGHLAYGILFLFSLGSTAVTGYSLYRGAQAEKEARISAEKIGRIDYMRSQEKELKKSMELSEKHLKQLAVLFEECASQTGRLSEFTHVIRYLGSLNIRFQALKRIHEQLAAKLSLALDEQRDERDERPMRIAAAKESSLNANGQTLDASKTKDEIVRNEVESGRKRSAQTLEEISALLENYHQAQNELLKNSKALGDFVRCQLELPNLFTLIPQQRIEFNRRIDFATNALDQSLEKISDFYALTHWMLETDPAHLKPKGHQTDPEIQKTRKERNAGFLKQNPAYQTYIEESADKAFDRVRRMTASVENWVHEGRGEPRFSAFRKAYQEDLGRIATRVANLGVVLTPFLVGLHWFSQNPAATPQSLGNLALGLLVGVAPSVGVALSNILRGSLRFDFSPALYENLADRTRYWNKRDQATVIERARAAIRPLAPKEAADYLADSYAKLKLCRELLKDLQENVRLFSPQLHKDEIPDTLYKDCYGLQDNGYPLTDSKIPAETAIPSTYARHAAEEDTANRKAARASIKNLSDKKYIEELQRGAFSHQDIYNMILSHPVADDGAVFPRSLKDTILGKKIQALVSEADQTKTVKRFILVKDLFGGLDQVVNAGSKNLHVEDMPMSPLVQKLIEEGYIPIPCNLTAGAMGGTGLENGYGAVGNAVKPGYDTAGSSSAEAYLLGLKDFPVRLAIGTDTGGSVSAPCGASGLYGWVSSVRGIPLTHMIPYSTHLDRVGVMGLSESEVMKLAFRLSVDKNLFHPSIEQPVVYYFNEDLDKVPAASQTEFRSQMEDLRKNGVSVIPLPPRFTKLRDLPSLLYRLSFVDALFVAMNPTQENLNGEPVRYALDANLMNRFGKARVLMENPADPKDPQGPSLADAFREVRNGYADYVVNSGHIPANALFIKPSPEAVLLDEFNSGGQGGALTDAHDEQNGGMLKHNNPNWAQMITKRFVLTGHMSYISHLLIRKLLH